MARIPVKPFIKGKNIEEGIVPNENILPNIPEDEITAWHGSPHQFPPVTEIISHKTGERILVDKNLYPDWTQHPDINASEFDFAGEYELGKFDNSKIGTGEGVQAYGYGMYFAERQATAGSYKESLTAKNVDSEYQFFLETKISEADQKGDYDLAELYEDALGINSIQQFRNKYTNENFDADTRKLANNIADELEGFTKDDGTKPNFGALYKVKIKAKQEEFINFDAILDDQENLLVKLEASDLNFAVEAAYNQNIGFNPTGNDLFKILHDGVAPEDVANQLNKIGIKGIKYKDAQTRFSPKGATYNYVVFDDKLISIANKYSISLFAAGSVSLGLMTPQEAQAQENPIGAPKPELGTPESANDNTSYNYIQSREDAYLERARQVRQRIMDEKTKQSPVSDPAPISAPVEEESTMLSVAKDIGTGILETPRAVVGGFLKATQEAGEALESVFGQLPTAGKDYKPITIDDPESTTGQLMQGISQFLTGFFPALKGAKTIGLVKSAPYAAGFLADATVFDPHEARLSDLIQEYPALQNPVTEYLQADPTDPEIEGRLKSGIEGLAIGGLTDSLIKAVKVIKANKTIKTEAKKEGITVEEFVGPIKPNDTVQAKVDEPEYIPFEDVADNNSIEVPASGKMGAGKAPDEAAENINLNRLETTEEVEDIITAVAKANPLEINQARREVITQKETEALADDLGMSVEDLLNRREGIAPNAEEAVAARNILVASGENLIKLAEKAKNGGDEALMLFRRAMSQHQAIQLQVSGMTAEAGRALQSFRIMAKSGAEQEKAIKEALEASGGLDLNQDLAKRLSQINDPAHLNRFVKNADKATTSEMIEEYWINALLSNPATHVMNIMSNASVVLSSVLERKVASIFGKEIETGEASAQILGIIEGAKDGMKLAKKVFLSGEASDPLTKIESAQREAISSKNLNASGVVGQSIDFLGNAIRIPGRALMAGDEFFKAVARRMELQSLAYRQAIKENLSPEDFTKRVSEILNNPSATIRMQMEEVARYQTFTNELGAIGKKGTQLRNSTGILGRLAVPFLRTPINVVKYAMSRTPVAPFMPSVRADFNAGGARRELMLSRMALGSTVMLVSSSMAQKGMITGSGPVNYKERQMLELTGWKPNSLKVGDTYYSLERADPIAALLLMSADITEIIGQVDEADAYDLAFASSVAVANSLESRTYFNGLMDFFDAYQNASRDPENKQNVLFNWLERMAATAVPAGVAAVARQVDPTVRLTDDLTSRLKSRLPAYSKDLPPRRNMFGDVVVLEGGLGPDIMSPIYMSTDKQNPIADEIAKHRVNIGMPRRSINGVELTAIQYDRFIQLSAGLEKKVSLEEILNKLIKTKDYKKLTDGINGGKAQKIEDFIQGYREDAREQVISEFPKLKSDIMSAEIKFDEERTGRKFSEQEQRSLGIIPAE